jgi:hypothetical protein
VPYPLVILALGAIKEVNQQSDVLRIQTFSMDDDLLMLAFSEGTIPAFLASRKIIELVT